MMRWRALLSGNRPRNRPVCDAPKVLRVLHRGLPAEDILEFARARTHPHFGHRSNASKTCTLDSCHENRGGSRREDPLHRRRTLTAYPNRGQPHASNEPNRSPPLRECFQVASASRVFPGRLRFASVPRLSRATEPDTAQGFRLVPTAVGSANRSDSFVFGPTIPSAANACCCWNSWTLARVLDPKMLSSARGGDCAEPKR